MSDKDTYPKTIFLESSQDISIIKKFPKYTKTLILNDVKGSLDFVPLELETLIIDAHPARGGVKFNVASAPNLRNLSLRGVQDAKINHLNLLRLKLNDRAFQGISLPRSLKELELTVINKVDGIILDLPEGLTTANLELIDRRTFSKIRIPQSIENLLIRGRVPITSLDLAQDLSHLKRFYFDGISIMWRPREENAAFLNDLFRRARKLTSVRIDTIPQQVVLPRGLLDLEATYIHYQVVLPPTLRRLTMEQKEGDLDLYDLDLSGLTKLETLNLIGTVSKWQEFPASVKNLWLGKVRYPLDQVLKKLPPNLEKLALFHDEAMDLKLVPNSVKSLSLAVVSC